MTNKRLPLRRCTQLAGAEGVGLVETQPSSAERGHFSGNKSRHRSREKAFALVVADSRSAVLFHLPLKPVAELAAASPAARFTSRLTHLSICACVFSRSGSGAALRFGVGITDPREKPVQECVQQ